MNVTIAEALYQKHRMENSFLTALREFEKETGLRVSRVDLRELQTKNGLELDGVFLHVEIRP